MAGHREVEWLLGRRFVCDFRVISIGSVPTHGTQDDREVVIMHLGERATLSYGELMAMVERGFVVESERA